MKIYILCLFIGLSLSQQEFSFDNMSKKWKDYKLGNQEDFQIMVLEYIANLDPSQKVDNIKLHFWMIRSLYSDGKIEEAIENYNDLMKEIEEKTLFHEPYRDQMQQCKNSKCICDDMRKYDPNHNENLDLMSPESLKEHFANVWIVIGRDGKTIHPPEFRPDDFIGNSKIGKHIVLVPIAFVSEHSETLVELDIEYKKLAKDNGCKQYTRVPALGINEDFIKAMSELIIKKEEYKFNDQLHPPKTKCPPNFKKCLCLNPF